MNIIDKLVRGDNYRKTRFHNEKGELVDFVGMTHAPRSFIGSLLRLGFDYRPVLPWIPYRAIREIESIIKKDWHVLEFGSGMSTIWFAQHCGFLHSIEHNEYWYNKVSRMIEDKNIKNIKYELRERNSYAEISDENDDLFDLIVVDGAQRSKSVKTALKKVKPLGFIYLDNSDKDMNGDMRIAETLLLEAVKNRNGQSRYFTDFVPCQLTACQGLLVRL